MVAPWVARSEFQVKSVSAPMPHPSQAQGRPPVRIIALLPALMGATCTFESEKAE